MAEAEREEGGGAQRQMLKVLRVCQAYRRCEKPCSTERCAEMPRATKRCVKQTDGHREEQAESCCVQSLSILDGLNLSTAEEWQAMGSPEVLSCTEDPYFSSAE
ncbi:unnamed protein product [Arctogadus glacialis]